jgi:glycosyltransferase involved in cell wall biosynthesis
MLLSVVIATLDRHEHLTKCLSSLIRSLGCQAQAGDVEVIVVDQSSELFRFTESSKSDITFQYFQFPIKNASSARNFGAQMACGRYLWFLDDDAEVLSFDGGALNSQDDVFFVCWSERLDIFSLVYPIRKLNILRRSGTPFYVVRRDVFNDAGGFNALLGPGSDLGGGEDFDLLLRVDKIAKVRSFCCVGIISHPLPEYLPEKTKRYFFARGFVLGFHREYMLLVFNLLYDFSKFKREGFQRVFLTVRGFFAGFRYVRT